MYYIYHIPQVKIGCSTQPNKRVERQGYSNFEILETHTDIHIASQREIELQKEYGYKVDSCTYFDSIKEFKIETAQKGGKASATKSWKENRDREMQKSYKGGRMNAEKTGKPVTMCDMNGNPIKEFKNRADAASFVDGFKSTLLGTIDKPNHSYKGYKWVSLLNNKQKL